MHSAAVCVFQQVKNLDKLKHTAPRVGSVHTGETKNVLLLHKNKRDKKRERSDAEQ